MHLEGAAAQLVGQRRRDVIDVGIVFALHQPGGRHHLDVVAPRGFDAGHQRAEALAAGDAEPVTVLDGVEHQVCRARADALQRRLRVVRNRRCNQRPLDAADGDELRLDADQVLDRRPDLDLDQSEGTAALDQPIDRGRG